MKWAEVSLPPRLFGLTMNYSVYTFVTWSAEIPTPEVGSSSAGDDLELNRARFLHVRA
jgi:hypothetical protein